jgi:hypothetical protein
MEDKQCVPGPVRVRANFSGPETGNFKPDDIGAVAVQWQITF